MATHYEVLEVSPAASYDAIRRAYLRQARRHHPDGHTGSGPEIVEEARRRMTAVNAAWAVLGDAAQRRAYDAEIGRPPPVAPAADDTTGPGGEYPEWFEPDDTAVAYLEEDPDDGQRGPVDMVVFVPVGLAALAIALFALSMMLQSPAMFSLSLVLVPVALVTFVAMPLVSMLGRSRARSKD